MNLPFTVEQFFEVFAQYNLAVWPMQVVIYALAIAALVLALRETKYSNRITSTILAFLWLWIGLVYHLGYFSTINRAAYVFGGLFIIQSLLFLMVGTLNQKLWFRFHPNSYAIVGTLFILYGLAIYPVLGYSLGHRYPHAPTFGLPCPTTIFTFGLLLWTDKRIPKYLLIIPVLWSIISLFAALQLGVWEDVVLLITGVATPVMIYYRDMREAELVHRPGF
jgi:drug/metabolite transporter superfamily protein YnfA